MVKEVIMKPLRAMKCFISKKLPPLHMLFTEEDGVVVVRCLDFSVSSHAETIEEAIESINSVLIDYIEYGIKEGDVESLFDPDLKEYWDIYQDLEIKMEKENFARHFKEIEEAIIKEKLVYA